MLQLLRAARPKRVVRSGDVRRLAVATSLGSVTPDSSVRSVIHMCATLGDAGIAIRACFTSRAHTTVARVHREVVLVSRALMRRDLRVSKPVGEGVRGTYV